MSITSGGVKYFLFPSKILQPRVVYWKNHFHHMCLPEQEAVYERPMIELICSCLPATPSTRAFHSKICNTNSLFPFRGYSSSLRPCPGTLTSTSRQDHPSVLFVSSEDFPLPLSLRKACNAFRCILCLEDFISLTFAVDVLHVTSSLLYPS